MCVRPIERITEIRRPAARASSKVPCRISVEENQRVAGTLVDVVHASAIDAFEFRLVLPLLVREPLHTLRMHAFAFCSPKVDHSLAVEARQPDNSAQAYAVHEIERDDFVLSDAVELAVRPEA